MTGASSKRRSRGPVHAGPMWVVFLALMGMWLLVPVLIRDNLGQDAVPYLVAGDLVRDQPHEVYASQHGDLFDLRPTFAQRFCELSPPDTDCGTVNVAFVSLPQVLPLTVVLAALGGQGGVLAMRLAAAACLVGGMLVLWRRLSGCSPRAPALLVTTTFLLTPFVMVPLSLAQTSPIMFVSAALGVSRSDRLGRSVGTSLVWMLSIVIKLFPGVLVLVLVRQRRWRLIALAAASFAVLTVAFLAIGPPSLFGDFLHTSVLLGEKSAANPYNGSVDALMYAVSPNLATASTSSIGSVVKLLGAGGLWWWAARDADDDVQWAYGWLVVMLIVPFLWWHYLWVAIAFIGVAVAAKADADRWLPALPAAALVALPLGVINSRGSSAPVPQALLLLLVIIGGGWAIRSGMVGQPTPETASDPAPA